MKKVMLFVISAILIASASAETQYNKIFLSPFYQSSMTNNVNNSMTLVIPSYPNKITNVTSALISFDIYINPTVTFHLWVNNQKCNNPNFTISTTYASAGQSRIMFDCSNIIKKDGIYDIILKPTQANTGSFIGWSDISYSLTSSGDIKIFGTEYSPDDLATVFLQLKDDAGLPVLNGSCYLDVFSPLLNGTHPLLLKNSPMLYAGGSDGIYYYDMLLTSFFPLGIYMLSATCSYSYNKHWLYEYGETAPVRAVIYGTYEGNSDNLLAPDNNYEKCTSQNTGAGRICQSYYLFNASDVYSDNITSFDIFWSGESSGTPTLTFQLWNFRTTSWRNLTNTLTLTATATTTSPSGVDFFVSNSLINNATVNVSDFIGNSSSGYPYTIWVQVISSSLATHTDFSNWLNVRTLTSFGTVYDIKGSGEIHLTNIPNATANLIKNITVNVNSSLLAESLWNYTNRSLTLYPDTNNYTKIGESVWNWVGNISSSITSAFSSVFWNDANYTKIAKYIWEYENRNLTFYQVNNISAGEIWGYMNRSLTLYPDMTNYTQIGDYVWNYVDRNLTFYQINNISAGEIWNYYNRSLSDNGILQIWSYPSRNLTTDIPLEVWSFENRTLTYYTINLTELIEMINNYTSTDIGYTLLPSQELYQLESNLNVMLISPQFIGK